MKISDSTISSLIKKEIARQEDTITLIASENYALDEVREAMGSVLTNKYAEGYPGKRYYAGCEFIDEIEQLAINRCKKLFKGEHANVQANSGSAANMAVMMALLKPGDTILGMSLASGGHLTHGHKVSFSGVLYTSVTYQVSKDTEQLDYEEIARLADVHKPKLIIAGASNYSRLIDFKKFYEIAQSVNAYLLADCAHIAGLVATGLHPYPYADVITGTTHKTLRGPRGGFIVCKEALAKKIDRAVFPLLQGGPFMNAIAGKAIAFHAAQDDSYKEYMKQVVFNAQTMARTFQELGYHIVSGGTDNHLFTLDLRSKKCTGKEAEERLAKQGIMVSRSMLPYDEAPPSVTSGIRLGTLAVTTRGYIEKDAIELAYKINEIL